MAPSEGFFLYSQQTSAGKTPALIHNKYKLKQMGTNLESIKKTPKTFLFSVPTQCIATVIGGFVLMKVWEWFIVSALKVPNLPFIHAMGIYWFITWIQNEQVPEDHGCIKELAWLWYFTLSAFIVFMGAFALHFLDMNIHLFNL